MFTEAERALLWDDLKKAALLLLALLLVAAFWYFWLSYLSLWGWAKLGGVIITAAIVYVAAVKFISRVLEHWCGDEDCHAESAQGNKPRAICA